MTMSFQVYIDRGNGLELDGCWGSEFARFDNESEATDGARHLHNEHPDCVWVVVDESDGDEVFRISSRESAQ